MLARERLAATLRRERRRRGWTQADAAHALGFDLRQYGRLERGEIDTTLSTLDRIARGLALDVADLLKRPRVRRPRAPR